MPRHPRPNKLRHFFCGGKVEKVSPPPLSLRLRLPPQATASFHRTRRPPAHRPDPTTARPLDASLAPPAPRNHRYVLSAVVCCPSRARVASSWVGGRCCVGRARPWMCPERWLGGVRPSAPGSTGGAGRFGAAFLLSVAVVGDLSQFSGCFFFWVYGWDLLSMPSDCSPFRDADYFGLALPSID